MKKIRCIQKVNKIENSKIKVAAYARVSHTKLLNSLSDQVSYYSKLIQSNPNWEYKGVYVDTSVSGKTTKKRKEYLRLIDDCKKGEIAVILTKSISRFGRNTIELLKTVRELKNKNISIRFEKENIDTLTTDGELLLTLLASIAEEESKSISQNIRWRVKECFEKGLPYIKQDMLGYRWQGESYVVYEKEAEIVRKVYSDYISGLTPKMIAKELNEKGHRTRKGYLFTRSIIHKILNQEAYTGMLILQKTYNAAHKGRTIDNKGERPKYIVENAHEPIISKEIFDEVQVLKKSRRTKKHDGENNE